MQNTEGVYFMYFKIYYCYFFKQCAHCKQRKDEAICRAFSVVH